MKAQRVACIRKPGAIAIARDARLAHLVSSSDTCGAVI